MARADDFIAMLDDPEAPAPKGEHPSDEPLIQILVHVACSDGVLQEQELSFLLEVLPGHDTRDILTLVSKIGSSDLDIEEVSARLGSEEERAAALRFAARLAWADEVIEDNEETMLSRLATGFGLSEAHLSNALDRILHQPVQPVSPADVVRATDDADLERAVIEHSPLFDDLAKVVPPDATPIARVLVGGKEAIGIYDIGMAGRFEEGDAFVPWGDVAYFTRVPLFGAAARVITHDDRTLTIGDRRLRDIGDFLGRVFGT